MKLRVDSPEFKMYFAMQVSCRYQKTSILKTDMAYIESLSIIKVCVNLSTIVQYYNFDHG